MASGGDVDVVRDFHRYHNTEDWKEYQCGDQKESFSVWLRRVRFPNDPTASVLSYTGAFALENGLDFDPFGDNIYTYRGQPPAANDATLAHYTHMRSMFRVCLLPNTKGVDFYHEELLEVLGGILDKTGSTSEARAEILQSMGQADNGSVLNLIRGMSKNAGVTELP